MKRKPDELDARIALICGAVDAAKKRRMRLTRVAIEAGAKAVWEFRNPGTPWRRAPKQRQLDYRSSTAIALSAAGFRT